MNDYTDISQDTKDKAIKCCINNNAKLIMIARTPAIAAMPCYIILADRPCTVGGQYVTWEFNKENGTYWGHYGMDFETALEDFSERIFGEKVKEAVD